MASYTIELREFVEKPLGMSTREHIELVRREVFDFPYPFYDEEHRPKFEENFIRHFYMREIGYESEHLFKLRLESWLNINMPYWNEVFKTQGMIKNPLINVDWTETRETERIIKSEVEGQTSANGESTSNSTGTNDIFNRDLESTTPDSRLQITTGEDGTGVIEYASSINETKNKNKSVANDQTETNQSAKNNETGESTDQYKDHFHVKGTQGMKTESEMLKLYRETLLRIESDIFFECNKLFMLVY